jgi:hypothetical protein
MWPSSRAESVFCSDTVPAVTLRSSRAKSGVSWLVDNDDLNATVVLDVPRITGNQHHGDGVCHQGFSVGLTVTFAVAFFLFLVQWYVPRRMGRLAKEKFSGVQLKRGSEERV